MLKVIEPEKAILLIAERLQNLNKTVCSIDNALGKILAKDIYSTENIPSFNRSSVDGYAVKASDIYCACQNVPSILKIIGEIDMGNSSKLIPAEGECVYVPTGGMVPKSCDAVVMIEDATRSFEDILVYKPHKKHENMIILGEDISKGEMIAHKGEILNSAKIGALAGAGITKITVYAPLNFSIISTGDEIIPANEELTPCKIRDINMHLLKAHCAPYGKVVDTAIIKDELDSLIAQLKEFLEISDVVLISGGSSVGNKDYTKRAILHFTNDLFIEGVALRPGKPTMAAQIGNKFIIGLPGHPMAASVAFRHVFLEGLHKATKTVAKNRLFAKAKTNFPSGGGRTAVMPVKLSEDADGYQASPLFFKSGLISVLAKADGYALIPAKEDGIMQGALLEIFPL